MKVIAVTIRMSLVLMVLCCLFYELAVTGIAQVLFPKQADGSLIYNDKNELIGSELIGQKFADPKFFQGRVSSIDYNANGSGTPNYAPSNPDMIKRVQDSVAAWKKDNPDVDVSKLPIDLITNSGSGLDPDISPESAEAQIPRISKLRGVSEDQLKELVKQHTEGRDWGIFGEPHVNVLKMNLALQDLSK
jgi:potassium-transporting ATPase KdpC subunit